MSPSRSSRSNEDSSAFSCQSCQSQMINQVNHHVFRRVVDGNTAPCLQQRADLVLVAAAGLS